MGNDAFDKAKKSLADYWGFDSFRSGQEEAIGAILEGRNTLVLFPTGGGKSVCYQVPATVVEGLTLVISPLVSLMQDQVRQLNDRGISATFVNSSLTSWEVEQRFVNARNGMYDLFYCSPERLNTHLFQAEAEKLNIDLIAIDEAHCISQWGHDFRLSYREIRPALEPVADSATWIALTATATPEVRDDIIANLQLEDPKIVSKGFGRPNLKWWVTQTARKDDKLLKAVRTAGEGSGLVYGGTRRNCERLAGLLSQKTGIAASAYHAGLENSERKAVQEQWISGELPLVVATNAFGMGIDKADCRYVIHYELPYSLEAYYQEAGRAGRDGIESYPILLYTEADVVRGEERLKRSYPEKEQLQQVYDVLADELNLALGSEMEEAEPVAMQALEKRSGLSQSRVRSALNVLNHLGVIQMMENVSPQISLRFIASRQRVSDLVDSYENRQKSDFLDTLFRQFGSEAFVENRQLPLHYLTRKLNTTRNGLIKGLGVLQDRDRVLEFKALGEMPLIQLVDERMSRLPFGKSELEAHRNTLLKKLEYMKGYVETEGCRETYIRSYFGEEGLEPCGHCDNCLREAGGDTRDGASAARIVQQVRDLLTARNGRLFDELLRATEGRRRELRDTLSFLVGEGRVETRNDRYYWKEEP